jgi:5'-nucleotidase (lipoprotein e(P4) family)
VAGDVLRRRTEDLRAGTWAVALDADETVISNSLFEKELIVSGKAPTDQSWQDWVERKEAPPLPGVMAFLDLVGELGGYIAIVTNRKNEHCPATEANFRAYDIPYDVMLCRGESREKEPRWQMVEDGTASPDLPPVEIVMWFGDNINDFPGLSQDSRQDPGPAMAAFGTKFFALPNPMYGSWRDNLED